MQIATCPLSNVRMEIYMRSNELKKSQKYFRSFEKFSAFSWSMFKEVV